MTLANVIPQEEVEARALQLAQAIVEYDRKDDETRQSSDNIKRRNRLDLGALICAAPSPEHLKQTLVAKTALTASEVSDIHAVAEFNLNSGFNDLLYENVVMSFTTNRNLALVRVATVKDARIPSVMERIAAMQRAIVRNGGRFKEDAEFRRDLKILAPPNSLANIMERAKQDPEYNQELQKQGVYIISVEETPQSHDDDPPVDKWTKRLHGLRTMTTHLRDEAFGDPEAPVALMSYCRESSDDLLAVADLIEGRLQMDGVGA